MDLSLLFEKSHLQIFRGIKILETFLREFDKLVADFLGADDVIRRHASLDQREWPVFMQILLDVSA